MDSATLQALLDVVAAEYVKRLGLRVAKVAPSEVTLLVPITPELVHAGGVVCGQAIMAAADTAMLVAMIAQLGEFRPMTTVQLQTSFLRPVAAEARAMTIVGRVLRFGKRLSYGEVECLTPDQKLAAHATVTYLML